jgi:hypothetical protein
MLVFWEASIFRRAGRLSPHAESAKPIRAPSGLRIPRSPQVNEVVRQRVEADAKEGWYFTAASTSKKSNEL